MVMAELGNLMAGILLSLGRMSTVKIRDGSLFCTSADRNGPAGAAWRGFPKPSTEAAGRSQDVHRPAAVPACAKPEFRCKVETAFFA
jgi:hypothetical protein